MNEMLIVAFLCVQKNGSDDGLYRIRSGIGGTVDHFAEIVTWNGNRWIPLIMITAITD